MKYTLTIDGTHTELLTVLTLLQTPIETQPVNADFANPPVRVSGGSAATPTEPEPEPGDPSPVAAKSNGAPAKRSRGRPIGTTKGPDGKWVVPEQQPAEPEIDPEHTDAAMLDKVRAFTVAHKHLNPEVDKLLQNYGADRVSRLPQDVRGTFLVQMEALLMQQAQPNAPQDRNWT